LNGTCVFLKRGKRNSSPKNENVVIYIHHHVPNLKGVVDFKKKKTFTDDNLLTPISSKMSRKL